jgi:hypothetical protein
MGDDRYPIGRFTPDPNPTPDTRNRHIEQISDLPLQMRRAVAGLDQKQLATPYGMEVGLSGRSSTMCRIAT